MLDERSEVSFNLGNGWVWNRRPNTRGRLLPTIQPRVVIGHFGSEPRASRANKEPAPTSPFCHEKGASQVYQFLPWLNVRPCHPRAGAGIPRLVTIECQGSNSRFCTLDLPGGITSRFPLRPGNQMRTRLDTDLETIQRTAQLRRIGRDLHDQAVAISSETVDAMAAVVTRLATCSYRSRSR